MSVLRCSRSLRISFAEIKVAPGRDKIPIDTIAKTIACVSNRAGYTISVDRKMRCISLHGLFLCRQSSEIGPKIIN